MVRCSNNVIGFLNFVTFVLSVPILGGGIWLATKADTDCEKFLQWPMIAIGGFLMVVSLAGLVGACCRVSWLLWLYSATMFLLILLLLCFTVFAFVITNKGAGKVVSGRGYKEYRLGDYSNWLQKRVEKSSNWNKIKSCLQDAKVCKSLADGSVNEAAEEFYRKNLSPTQVIPLSFKLKLCSIKYYFMTNFPYHFTFLCNCSTSCYIRHNFTFPCNCSTSCYIRHNF